MRKKCGEEFYKILQKKKIDIKAQDIKISKSTFFTVAFYIKKNISWEDLKKIYRIRGRRFLLCCNSSKSRICSKKEFNWQVFL